MRACWREIYDIDHTHRAFRLNAFEGGVLAYFLLQTPGHIDRNNTVFLLYVCVSVRLTTGPSWTFSRTLYTWRDAPQSEFSYVGCNLSLFWTLHHKWHNVGLWELLIVALLKIIPITPYIVVLGWLSVWLFVTYILLKGKTNCKTIGPEMVLSLNNSGTVQPFDEKYCLRNKKAFHGDFRY